MWFFDGNRALEHGRLGRNLSYEAMAAIERSNLKRSEPALCESPAVQGNRRRHAASRTTRISRRRIRRGPERGVLA